MIPSYPTPVPNKCSELMQIKCPFLKNTFIKVYFSQVLFR